MKKILPLASLTLPVSQFYAYIHQAVKENLDNAVIKKIPGTDQLE